jgi:hypothetical protein
MIGDVPAPDNSQNSQDERNVQYCWRRVDRKIGALQAPGCGTALQEDPNVMGETRYSSGSFYLPRSVAASGRFLRHRLRGREVRLIIK